VIEGKLIVNRFCTHGGLNNVGREG